MLTFKPYTAERHDECIELFKSNVPKFFDASETDDYSNYLKQHGGEDYWCAFIQNQLVGAGGIFVRPNGVGRLVWGMIRQDLHRKGYGKQLIVFRLKKLASIPGVETIQLDTTQYNPGFFRRFGFCEVSVKENFYCPGLHSHEMELKLDSDARKMIIGL